MRIKMLMLSAAIALAACQTTHPLDERYNTPRAKLGDEPIEVTHQPAPVDVGPMVNQQPVGEAPPAVPGVQDVITGTWTFTTPPTTTRVERKTADLQQFSIYAGRPAGTDKPFVVITIAPPEGDKGSQTEAEPDRFKVSNTRSYTLNGAIAREWTGRTADGSAFCELLLTRPGGGGDVCHAMAIARSEAQRKEALDILGSISWQATGAPAAE
jgi:hypothetical protein